MNSAAPTGTGSTFMPFSTCLPSTSDSSPSSSPSPTRSDDDDAADGDDEGEGRAQHRRNAGNTFVGTAIWALTPSVAT